MILASHRSTSSNQRAMPRAHPHWDFKSQGLIVAVPHSHADVSRPAAMSSVPTPTVNQSDGSQNTGPTFRSSQSRHPQRAGRLRAGCPVALKIPKDRRINNCPVLVCDHHAERDGYFEIATVIDSPVLKNLIGFDEDVGFQSPALRNRNDPVQPLVLAHGCLEEQRFTEVVFRRIDLCS